MSVAWQPVLHHLPIIVKAAAATPKQLVACSRAICRSRHIHRCHQTQASRTERRVGLCCCILDDARLQLQRLRRLSCRQAPPFRDELPHSHTAAHTPGPIVCCEGAPEPKRPAPGTTAHRRWMGAGTLPTSSCPLYRGAARIARLPATDRRRPARHTQAKQVLVMGHLTSAAAAPAAAPEG